MNNSNLIWSHLKNNKCPKCNSLLKRNLLEETFSCINPRCTFRMSSDTFNSIVNDLYKPKRKRKIIEYDENASELNNLGYSIITEDFSDSHYHGTR